MLLRIAAVLLLTTPCCLAARFDAAFPGGAIGQVEQVSPVHYRVGVIGEKDQEGRNRQASWFYFYVTNPPSGDLTIDLVDLPGEYNYQPNKGPITAATPPFLSFDNKHWEPVTTCEYDEHEPRLRLHIHSEGRPFWLARLAPYTSRDLERLRVDVRRHPEAREQTIGRSVEGRELYLWTITAPGAIDQRKVIWLFFRQHSWETGTSWTGEGAVRALLDRPELRRDTVWKIVPASDPDGLAKGGVRFNRRGYDLNRNWDVDSPKDMPEIAAERTAVQQWLQAGHPVDLLFSLHNTETSEYLEAPPAKFQPLAERFFALLKDQTTFAPTRPLFYAERSTSADRPGRMTIIQGLFARFGVPGFLMEQRIARHPKLDRFPTVEDRLQFGSKLVRAAWAAVWSRPYPGR